MSLTLKDDNDAFTYLEEEKILFDNGEMLYGKLFLPDGKSKYAVTDEDSMESEGKLPIVIYSHELACNHTYGIPYAKRLADMGIAAYTFDFRGGGPFSRSDGKTTQMSVLTNSEDLLAVAKQVKAWDFVDPERIFLMGGSQGGLAAAMAAAKKPDLFAGLVLLYPGLHIPEVLHESFPSVPIKEMTFNFHDWINLGRPYVADMWNYDVYREIVRFKKPVLIIHGDHDDLVPIDYSIRASEAYKDCKFVVMEGKGHIFTGKTLEEAFCYIRKFMKKHV